jgi:hypothetical protein
MLGSIAVRSLEVRLRPPDERRRGVREVLSQPVPRLRREARPPYRRQHAALPSSSRLSAGGHTRSVAIKAASKSPFTTGAAIEVDGSMHNHE